MSMHGNIRLCCIGMITDNNIEQRINMFGNICTQYRYFFLYLKIIEIAHRIHCERERTLLIKILNSLLLNVFAKL